jgi:hypothetical protein
MSEKYFLVMSDKQYHSDRLKIKILSDMTCDGAAEVLYDTHYHHAQLPACARHLFVERKSVCG